MKPSRRAWTTFELAPSIPYSEERARQFAREMKVSLEAARDSLLKLAEDQIYVNSIYQVNVNYNVPTPEGWPPLIHVSIKRRNRLPIHDWRDLQRIKNEIIGPEYEAVELYPAESRLVDSANQYHLWVVNDPNYRFPFGFSGRFAIGDSRGGAKQRPRKGD